MIVECEKCHTKFQLDDTLLKKTGSKVRCSVCNHTFMVFPPKPTKEGPEEPEAAPQKEARKVELDSDFDKTLVGDVVEKGEKEASEKLPDAEQTLDGDASLDDEIEPVSFEDISQIDSGIIREASPDIGKAMDRATKIEEEIIAKKEEGKDKEVSKAEEPAPPRPKLKKKKKSSKAVLTVLILLLFLVGGAAAVVTYMPELIPESIPFLHKPAKHQPLDRGNKRLSFTNLKGSFFDSDVAGKLFVVTGSIRNDYPDKRSFIRIRSNILDSQGKVAKSKIVYAGNPISKNDLQTLTMREINNKLMNRAGTGNINMNIAPNASVPIMIVFANLPKDVSEFTVEAISSSPARR